MGGRLGRRTKLTPEVQERICDAIRAGNFFEVACESAGISAVTGYSWMQRGEGTHPTRKRTKQHVEFVDAVRAAECLAEVELVPKWRQVDDWRGIAEFLSRRFPERWTPRQRREVSGPGGGPQEHVISGVVATGTASDQAVRAAERAYLDSLSRQPAVVGGKDETEDSTSPAGADPV